MSGGPLSCPINKAIDTISKRTKYADNYIFRVSETKNDCSSNESDYRTGVLSYFQILVILKNLL